MKTSVNGLNFIKNEEGVRYKAYKDARGLLTIGVGHLIKPTETSLKITILTDQQVLDLLAKDVIVAENAINNLVKQPLTQNQFDALCSFIFNVGDGAFKNSSLLQKINVNPNDQKFIQVKDIPDSNVWLKNKLITAKKVVVNSIAYCFMLYHKVNHVPNEDLYERRNREFALFIKK